MSKRPFRNNSGLNRASLTLAALAGLALTACSGAASKVDVPECAQPQSAGCARALDRIQILRYDDVSADRLIAAASRAAGDLNFELIRRDDATGIVLARYVGSAPTHKDQLDSRFHSALKDTAALPLLTRIEVGKPEATGSTPVRVQLLMPPAGSDGGGQTPPVPLDRVSPYEIFFEQLSLELGGRIAPPADEALGDQDKRRKKPTDLPGSTSVPTSL